MKIAACILFLISAGFFVDAGVDQFTGHAKAYSPGRASRLHEAYRDKDPVGFKGLMSYQWIRASLAAGAGFILLSIIRRADSLNPLASDQ
jgi:hypothetical protein